VLAGTHLTRYGAWGIARENHKNREDGGTVDVPPDSSSTMLGVLDWPLLKASYIGDHAWSGADGSFRQSQTD
jgi:hypothetical protein